MDEYEREEILSKVAEEIYATVIPGSGPPTKEPTDEQVRQVRTIVNVKNKEVLRKYNSHPWEVVEYLDRKTRKDLPGYVIKKHHGYVTETWAMDTGLFMHQFLKDKICEVLKNPVIVDKMSGDWTESLVGGFCSIGSPPRASTFSISTHNKELKVDLRVHTLTRPFVNDEAFATPEGSEALLKIVQASLNEGPALLVCVTRTDIGPIKVDSQISVLFSHLGEITKVAYYLAGDVAYSQENKTEFPRPVKMFRNREENVEYIKSLYGGRTGGGTYEEVKRRRF